MQAAGRRDRSTITRSSGSSHNRDAFAGAKGPIGPVIRSNGRAQRGDGSDSANARSQLASVSIAFLTVTVRSQSQFRSES